MARHRGDEESFRGISRGPVLAAIAVVVLILIVVGWFQLREHTGREGAEAAATCVSGKTRISVAADATIAPSLSQLARRYNDTKPVIRDHCVTVDVVSADSATEYAALTEPKPPSGGLPALWIPQSSLWTARLAASAPAALLGNPESLVTSPVVLAIPEAEHDALEVAHVGWADLPRLQRDPHSLDRMGLPGWGGLRLALPSGDDSDATDLTRIAVATAAAGAGRGPVTLAQAHSAEVTGALSDLATGAATPPTTAQALTTLGRTGDRDSAPLHGVPVTEAQLTQAADSAGDSPVTAYAPTGATPVADYPAAVLGGSGADDAASRAAAAFVDYLRHPEQLRTLVDAGFHVTAAEPLPSPAPSTDSGSGSGSGGTRAPAGAAVAEPMTMPDAATLAALTPPPSPPAGATTILLDISGSMATTESGHTRLENTTAAVQSRVDDLPQASDVGLWVYSADLDGTTPWVVSVPTGTLSDGGFDSGTRRQEIDHELASLSPATATHTYAAVEAAYDRAVTDFVAGRANSVLLITDGPNDDAADNSASDFLAAIRAAQDPNKPVRVDVIAIGPNSDLATLNSLARQTGGTVATVDNSADPALPDAVAAHLS